MQAEVRQGKDQCMAWSSWVVSGAEWNGKERGKARKGEVRQA